MFDQHSLTDLALDVTLSLLSRQPRAVTGMGIRDRYCLCRVVYCTEHVKTNRICYLHPSCGVGLLARMAI